MSARVSLLLDRHAGIAVRLGLPVFSGAMIIADAVFLPDRFYASLPRLGRRTARRLGVRLPRPRGEAGAGSVPPQARPEAPGLKLR